MCGAEDPLSHLLCNLTRVLFQAIVSSQGPLLKNQEKFRNLRFYCNNLHFRPYFSSEALKFISKIFSSQDPSFRGNDQSVHKPYNSEIRVANSYLKNKQSNKQSIKQTNKQLSAPQVLLEIIMDK